MHPQAVEWEVAEVKGVRRGNVVAFSVPHASGEQLVVTLETRFEDTTEIVESVRKVLQRELSLSVHDVACLLPGSLPKTSSGKLQRRKTRQLYLTGKLDTASSRLVGSRGSRLTVARHVASSIWSRAKATLRG